MSPSLADPSSAPLTVPLGGNAWTTQGGSIRKEGLTEWTAAETVCTTYLRLSQPGTIKLTCIAKSGGGKSTVEARFAGKSFPVELDGEVEKEYAIGEAEVKQAGYVAVTVQGKSKTGISFGSVASLLVSGTAVTADAAFVPSSKPNDYYWTRRGPSVHLGYDTKPVKDIEWFYNEVTVPTGNDVMGSYFMANGFGEGYFGFQVNGPTERRVLFSVWSPFKTDNPKAIPQEKKIVMLKKGKDVHAGEFGNEGSGGQSYLVFPWKAGQTYKFLMHAKPTDTNSTVYTAYFRPSDEKEWRLIASFQRPETTTYLRGLHSFLENFNPQFGNVTREVSFANQWVRDAAGAWTALTTAKFTGDATAGQNHRKDYAGGIKEGRFYLKNCGFFNEFVPLNGKFTIPANGKPPELPGNGGQSHSTP